MLHFNNCSNTIYLFLDSLYNLNLVYLFIPHIVECFNIFYCLLVHLEEFESAESAERTLSGHDENVEALSYRCM